MSPHEFTFSIVLPTARDLLANRRDRRIAYLACCAAYHLPDLIAAADGIERWRVCDEALLVCGPAFSLIEGVTRGRLDIVAEAGSTVVLGLAGAIGTSAFGMGRFKAAGAEAAGADRQRTDVYDAILTVIRYFAVTFPVHFSLPIMP